MIWFDLLITLLFLALIIFIPSSIFFVHRGIKKDWKAHEKSEAKKIQDLIQERNDFIESLISAPRNSKGIDAKNNWDLDFRLNCGQLTFEQSVRFIIKHGVAPKYFRLPTPELCKKPTKHQVSDLVPESAPLFTHFEEASKRHRHDKAYEDEVEIWREKRSANNEYLAFIRALRDALPKSRKIQLWLLENFEAWARAELYKNPQVELKLLIHEHIELKNFATDTGISKKFSKLGVPLLEYDKPNCPAFYYDHPSIPKNDGEDEARRLRWRSYYEDRMREFVFHHHFKSASSYMRLISHLKTLNVTLEIPLFKWPHSTGSAIQDEFKRWRTDPPTSQDTLIFKLRRGF